VPVLIHKRIVPKNMAACGFIDDLILIIVDSSTACAGTVKVGLSEELFLLFVHWTAILYYIYRAVHLQK